VSDITLLIIYKRDYVISLTGICAYR